MNYLENKVILKSFYYQNGLSRNFENDSDYLEEAFNEINTLWIENLSKIEKVKYLMIAEAPLWGRTRKYIYNPDINNSQFFYRSDLGDILKKRIVDKRSFIKLCNEIGLFFLDISPFPLNPEVTSINYRDLTKYQYRQLLSLTVPTYFEKKIMAIGEKKSKNIKVFFRYARVRTNFQDIIAKALIENKFIHTSSDIQDISQNGGGINKEILGKIIC